MYVNSKSVYISYIILQYSKYTVDIYLQSNIQT
jgi:hypothetical protein